MGVESVRTVTSVRDGREHLVTDDAIEAGQAGRYVALCGYRMLAAALSCPPGPPCSACAAIRTLPAQEALPRSINPDTGTAERNGRGRGPGCSPDCEAGPASPVPAACRGTAHRG